MEKTNPDVIILNETMYRNNEQTKLKNYKSFTKNREQKSGGGIEIMIKTCFENHAIKVSEGTNEIEELTVRIETKKRILNIITLYGKTENNKNEIIREQFTLIENIIENIEKEGEDYILIGDLNAKIGREKNGIKGNNESKNEAGKALLNLEQRREGVIVNKTIKCEGKWTRVNTKNINKKSILDYVFTNINLYEDIINMKIDEDRIHKQNTAEKKLLKLTIIP